MSQKLFISYRRQDSGANALGISQYLEHEFGRKNVFIDVDMRAGAKFPVILQQRLAECKVMLVLIGPHWLNSLDEHGRRRLDISDDWVRLEIAEALKRNITVIPVRVGDAPLPAKEGLPDDIRGLLDYQAVSITLAGFRHQMAGLVRDIRAIRSPRKWGRSGTIAAGLFLALILLTIGIGTSMFPPWRNSQNCRDAWSDVNVRGALGYAKTLIEKDCAVMYREGWLKNPQKLSSDALPACVDAWNSLVARGALPSARFLVMHTCPGIERKDSAVDAR